MEKGPIYRAGIMGLGFIGAADQISGNTLGQRVEDLDGTHISAYTNHPRIRIVCGSSRDEGRRKRFTARLSQDVRTYADWREMLSSSNLDIVSIATYTPAHAEMVVSCAEAGVPVIYCEKPIAGTIAEAELMLSTCRTSGSLLVINHNRRFNPNFRRLRSLVAQGILGELTSVTTRWASGRLGNIGTHIIDAVQMITGLETVAVSGTLDLSIKADCRGSEFNDPGGWGLIRLKGGSIVTVDASNYAKCPLVIELQGTLGTASIFGKDMSIRIFSGNTLNLSDKAIERSSMDTAAEEIVDWLDARSDGDRLPVFSSDPYDALHTLETIVAFHASDARSGAWVELPLTDNDRQIMIRSG